MLTFEDMVIRLAVALVLGIVIGLERELIGKEAGIRTAMLVCGGAAIFSMIGLALPYITALSEQNLADILARNSGFLSVIANIVVGIGFLGAGIIIKQESRVLGLTTAAVIWTTAGIGVLVGIGLIKFAVVATLAIALLLYVMKGISFKGNADMKGDA